MKVLTSRFVSPFVTLAPLGDFFSVAFLAKASCNTETKGQFPERKTACSQDLASFMRLAKSSPTKVFHAPGTPVIKQIDFFQRLRESSMIFAIFPAVFDKFLAHASDLVISVTECPS